MCGDAGKLDLDQIMERCIEDTGMADRIKKDLSDKNALDGFTRYRFDPSMICSDEDPESLFKRYLSAKIIAQLMMNWHYDSHSYEGCTFNKNISDLLRTEGQQTLNDISSPNVDHVVASIVKYIVMFQILYKLEKKVPVRKCEYCDNVIEEGDIQCSVCLGDLDSYKEEPLSIGENGIHEKDKFMGTDKPACDKLSQEEELLCRNDGREDKECGQERDGGREGTDKDKKKSFSPEVSKNAAAEAGITNSKDIEREESKGGWSCGQCSFINKLGTAHCVVCHFIRETEVTNQNKNRDKDDTKKGVYVEAGSWRCTSCSTENTPIMAVCSSCKHWRCEKCTFVNEELSRKCETCGNKNDNLGLCSACQNNYINEWRKRKKDRRSPKMANQEIGENDFEVVDICSNCKEHKKVNSYGINALGDALKGINAAGDFVKGIGSAIWSKLPELPKVTTDVSTWYKPL